MSKLSAVFLIACIVTVVLLIALPVLAQDDQCEADADPRNRPEWCDPTPTSPPDDAPVVTPQVTPIQPGPAPTVAAYPAPDPVDSPAPYPAPEQSKPWRVFGMTAKQWGELLPFEHREYRSNGAYK